MRWKTDYVFVPVPKSMRIGICIERRLLIKNYPEFCVKMFLRTPKGWRSVEPWYSNN